MRDAGAWCVAAGLIAAVLAPSPSGADEADGVAFFERKIRPVLVKECYPCHSSGARRIKGGLRLDSRAGVLEGGDSGPAVVPGEPGESRLLDALRYDGIEMPPRSRLPGGVVADFERWIELGAPDPRAGEAAPAGAKAGAGAGVDIEAARRSWAYRPPRRHAPPDVADADWPRTDIDRFLLASMEARGLRPVGDAGRPSLARRLYYDLAGLPPSPEEVASFVADPSPDAYEKLVDRLLASPRFGERWGRHWLDVARFGESLTLRGFVLGQAWRYRDYAIDAFNADLPYDRFVREQVAGDLLPASGVDDRRRKLAATTFLALGNTNLEEQDKEQLVMDVVDEQLDTIGRAFLAQTIGCARCHDHKFDPIPTLDYYALAGILRNTKTLEHANVSKWLERPLPAPPDQEAAIRAHEGRVASLEGRIREERGRMVAEGGAPALAPGAIGVGDVPGVVVDDSRARKVGEWKESRSVPTFIGAGYVHDDSSGKGEKTITFRPDLPEAGRFDVWLAYTSGSNRSTAVPVTILSADGEKTVTVDLRAAPPVDGRFVPLGRFAFEKDGRGSVMVSNEGTTGYVAVDAVAFIPVDRAAAATPAGPDGEGRAKLLEMEAELKRIKAGAPRRDMVLTVEEGAAIGDARVHVRGSVHNLGEPAPRGFLRVATLGEVPPFPPGESGRRELAGWLGGEANPLAARVFVNRAWHWLFGAGIVRTVDNFGSAGEPPSDPDLLDDLAARFAEDGWSVKSLVRRIVLSRAYRLSTADDPKGLSVDPENRLLWRMNRRRLDAECLRDTILSVGGRLRLEMGGPGFPPGLAADYGFKEEDDRRSVYLPVFRNALPELFEAFDFADPSLVVGRRDSSIVAPQALFLMNHPFVADQARHAARRLLAGAGLDDGGRVDRAYRLALGRPPTEAELRIGLAFVAGGADPAGGPEGAWAALFRALFSSVDFRYIN